MLKKYLASGSDKLPLAFYAWCGNPNDPVGWPPAYLRPSTTTSHAGFFILSQSAERPDRTSRSASVEQRRPPVPFVSYSPRRGG